MRFRSTDADKGDRRFVRANIHDRRRLTWIGVRALAGSGTSAGLIGEICHDDREREKRPASWPAGWGEKVSQRSMPRGRLPRGSVCLSCSTPRVRGADMSSSIMLRPSAGPAKYPVDGVVTGSGTIHGRCLCSSRSFKTGFGVRVRAHAQKSASNGCGD